MRSFIQKDYELFSCQHKRALFLDIPIFHKIYDLYKLLHSYQARIPKSERYTLWQRCENTTLALLEALIETNHQKGED